MGIEEEISSVVIDFYEKNNKYYANSFMCWTTEQQMAERTDNSQTHKELTMGKGTGGKTSTDIAMIN